MNLQRIKSFFSKKEQIKVMYNALKEDKDNYFTFLMASDKIVNPSVIAKAFFILKKDIPENESYWWTRSSYWFSCILIGIIFILSIPVSFYNIYIGLPFMLISFISLIYSMNKKMKQSADFCHLLFKDKEHVLFFKNWILQEYSKIERKTLFQKQHSLNTENYSRKKRL